MVVFRGRVEISSQMAKTLWTADKMQWKRKIPLGFARYASAMSIVLLHALPLPFKTGISVNIATNSCHTESILTLQNTRVQDTRKTNPREYNQTTESVYRVVINREESSPIRLETMASN
jgi:hypothetical protein